MGEIGVAVFDGEAKTLPSDWKEVTNFAFRSMPTFLIYTLETCANSFRFWGTNG